MSAVAMTPSERLVEIALTDALSLGTSAQSVAHPLRQQRRQADTP